MSAPTAPNHMLLSSMNTENSKQCALPPSEGSSPESFSKLQAHPMIHFFG
jgi:hypothetical protein